MQPFSPSPPNPVREGFAPRGLVDMIAKEMWLLYGRNGTLNWGGVERHLTRLVDQSRADAANARTDIDSVTAAWPTPVWSGRRAHAPRANTHGDRP